MPETKKVKNLASYILVVRAHRKQDSTCVCVVMSSGPSCPHPKKTPLEVQETALSPKDHDWRAFPEMFSS